MNEDDKKELNEELEPSISEENELAASTVEDVKNNDVKANSSDDDNINDNLRRAVKEKNSIIRELKEANEDYKKQLEVLKKELEEKEKEEEQDPFLDENEKETPELKEKIKSLEEKSKMLDAKIHNAETQKQVQAIDDELNSLKRKYNLSDDEATNLLITVYKKTKGVVNDLSVFEDFLLAEKKREELRQKNRSELSTETPTNRTPNIDKTPRTIEEAFAFLRRRKK